MAFQQGLSGLNASSRALDVIGNNVANSSTVGFKAADAHFADIYAASLAGGSALQIGIGTTLAAVTQQFTQGNISTTNNPLDLAINGNGFFCLSKNGVNYYTRNGQFHLDSTGKLVNDQNLQLRGYQALPDGTISSADATELQLTPDLLKLTPVATGSGLSGTGVEMSLNLDSRDDVTTWVAPAAATPAGTVVTIDPANYNFSRGVTIYDSLGNPHAQTFYFVKNATAGSWSMYGNVDGKMPAAGDTPNLTTGIPLTFNSNGTLATVNGVAVDPTTGAATPLAMTLSLAAADNLGGATSPLTPVPLNLTGTTQYGSAFSTDRLTQDGYSAGTLAGLSVTGEGIIQGNYTNGQTRNIAQVALAAFQNPNGLANVGGNKWVETAASGQPATGKPETGQLGAIQSNAVEDSNTDLTTELVKMITQQRNYQANAQTIKTQDSIMQTLINMR
ncbi:flagellar hook protein FlgE [Rhodocyclus tenuis]|uniref:Flagellar hook protein FlgE n=1 Tax=Rhodocyclus tenuis TaxID=1066 RepID=A0A840GEQ1_RHOTE|nr:flagellar hook protein FlgE [Rhodocyclus tenuis]MBB4246699.1 flagellar hook protein FlgE [Rhodocyclus tenuis]MBK1679994.1 flagellar hook protein FlgE [Rhodocyclus tenuis]